jgi:hypothetical protein
VPWPCRGPSYGEVSLDVQGRRLVVQWNKDAFVMACRGGPPEWDSYGLAIFDTNLVRHA